MIRTRIQLFHCTQVCRHGESAADVVPEAPGAAVLQQSTGMLATRRHLFDWTQVCRHGALAVGVEPEAPEASILQQNTGVIHTYCYMSWSACQKREHAIAKYG